MNFATLVLFALLAPVSSLHTPTDLSIAPATRTSRVDSSANSISIPLQVSGRATSKDTDAPEPTSPVDLCERLSLDEPGEPESQCLAPLSHDHSRVLRFAMHRSTAGRRDACTPARRQGILCLRC